MIQQGSEHYIAITDLQYFNILEIPPYELYYHQNLQTHKDRISLAVEQHGICLVTGPDNINGRIVYFIDQESKVKFMMTYL